MYRILLAEDEVTLREVVEVFFRKNGFEIDAVDNGNDACSLADRQKYDVVILAVAHKEFLNIDIRSLLNENGLVYDVKGILPRDVVDGRL